MTDSQISSGESPFYSRVTIGSDLAARGQILVPSPWITYVLLSLIFSAILVFLTVRMLRPAADAPSASAPRPPKEQREAAQ